MATSPETIVALLDQLNTMPAVSTRKMFGEYALYCGGKITALVCDDQLFVKPTAAGRTFIGKVVEACPYPGAAPSFLVTGDRWEDSDWLAELITITAAALPAPKPKKIAP